MVTPRAQGSPCQCREPDRRWRSSGSPLHHRVREAHRWTVEFEWFAVGPSSSRGSLHRRLPSSSTCSSSWTSTIVHGRAQRRPQHEDLEDMTKVDLKDTTTVDSTRPRVDSTTTLDSTMTPRPRGHTIT